MGRTCGEPDEIKKNTHPKYFTALFREQDDKEKVRRAKEEAEKKKKGRWFRKGKKEKKTAVRAANRKI